jgi:hypothetical protein
MGTKIGAISILTSRYCNMGVGKKNLCKRDEQNIKRRHLVQLIKASWRVCASYSLEKVYHCNTHTEAQHSPQITIYSYVLQIT